MIVRIPIYKIKTVTTPLDDSDNTGGTGGSGGNGSSGSDNEASKPTFGKDQPPTPQLGHPTDVEIIPDLHLPEVNFSLAEKSIAEFHSSRYPHPVVSMTVNVPEEDLPRVKNWLYGTPTNPPAASETLLKRLTSAATLAIDCYFDAAGDRHLFTSPFRVGWALRFAGGNLKSYGTPTLFEHSPETPLLALRDFALQGTLLQTTNELFNTPAELTVTVPAFTLPPSMRGNVTHIVIYACKPASLFAESRDVVGLRSASHDSQTLRVWSYPRRDPGAIIGDAANGDDLRIIGEIPIAEAAEGYESAFPVSGNLNSWSDYKKFTEKDNSGSGSGSGGSGTGSGSGSQGSEGSEGSEGLDEPAFHPHVLIETEALDLDMPEREKWIRGLTVRGVFRRDPLAMTVTLWGSHHREEWRRLATGHGAILRRLRGVRCRWLKLTLDIHLRPGDSVDALTFDIS